MSDRNKHHKRPRTLEAENTSTENISPLQLAAIYLNEGISNQEAPIYGKKITDILWGGGGVVDEVGYLTGSDKQGSHTEGSFVHVGSSVIPNNALKRPNKARNPNSYVMVHHRRADSSASNQTSADGSEILGYSVPPSYGSSSVECYPEAEYDVEIMDKEEDTYHSMPHDQKAILFNMCSPESSDTYNPYPPEATLSTYGDSPIPREHENSPYILVPMLPQIGPSSNARAANRFSMVASGSDAPWTHMQPRAIYSGTSCPTFFAISPGLAGEQDQDERRSGISLSTTEPPSRSLSQESRSPKSMSQKGKEKAIELGWEHNSVISQGGFQYTTKLPESRKKRRSHVQAASLAPKVAEKAVKLEWEHNYNVVNSGGLQYMSKPAGEQKPQRSGIRTGSLDPKAAEKARTIRRITACWNCWIQKVPCSVGQPCDRCKKQWAPTAFQICNRSHFKEYQGVFFPEYLHSHLKKRKIEEFFSEHTSGWTDTVIEVEVSVGACFKPMRLTATVFRPETTELLWQHRLAADQEPQYIRRLVIQNSAPVGLLGVSIIDLKDKCREHVGKMIQNPIYAAQVTAGDKSRISYTILDAAQRYHIDKESSLIERVLMLHAIHYYMKSFVSFTEDSARDVFPACQVYGGQPEHYLSSRLLNRQIKYAMHKLRQDVTTDVLEGLERVMRQRKDSWGLSFCTFLVLCLCMEGLQIASDTYVVCDMQIEGSNSVYTRDQSLTACRNIDEHPFTQFQKLFHDIYRSHRESYRVDREGGFNPLRNLANNGVTGLDSDHEADTMVKSIYQMISRSYLEIIFLSENPPLIGMGCSYDFDTKAIKANGTGRLASKFLRSFFPPTWMPLMPLIA